MSNATGLWIVLFIVVVAIGVAIDARRNRAQRRRKQHGVLEQQPIRAGSDDSQQQAAGHGGVLDRPSGWWGRRSPIAKIGIVVGALAIAVIVFDALVPAQRPRSIQSDTEPPAPPVSQEAYQQAFDRTSKWLLALDQCAEFWICGPGHFGAYLGPGESIEKNLGQRADSLCPGLPSALV